MKWPSDYDAGHGPAATARSGTAAEEQLSDGATPAGFDNFGHPSA
jgi:hypothetical protein